MIAKQVPRLSPLGSGHIPVETPVSDSFEGITNEQVLVIIEPCSILVGNSTTEVMANLRQRDQDRAADCSAAEAT